jgi:hypothetical protein
LAAVPAVVGIRRDSAKATTQVIAGKTLMEIGIGVGIGIGIERKRITFDSDSDSDPDPEKNQTTVQTT